MDSEDREFLEKTFELAKENNRMLHGMRRAAWWGRLMSLVYWVLIIAASVALYRYLQPLMTSVLQMYQTLIQNAEKVGNTVGGIQNLDTSAIQSAINGMLNKMQ